MASVQDAVRGSPDVQSCVRLIDLREGVLVEALLLISSIVPSWSGDPRTKALTILGDLIVPEVKFPFQPGFPSMAGEGVGLWISELQGHSAERRHPMCSIDRYLEHVVDWP